jgi:uncharacterized protein (TIGR03000 family)
MYSVLLLAAMTTGEAAPALHHRGHGASNCNAYLGHSWGSWGSCYGGCYGIGYTGWVNIGGWGHPHAAAAGGWGLPYGADVGWGQAYSGDAGWGRPYAGYGFSSAGHGGYWPGYMGYGGGGGYSSHAYGYGGGLVVPSAKVITPSAEQLPPGTVIDGKQTARQAGSETSGASQTARLIVDLPEGARLFVDDGEVAKPGTSRTFRTPALEKGEVYYYELRAEIERDGKVLSQKRRVVVSAGKTVTADFRNLGSATSVAAASPR